MSQDCLDVIRIAASHPNITLFTLNTPRDSINDTTLLGMAAWLDTPDVVQLLLQCSSSAVSVDSMDTDGATPLMCTSSRVRFTLRPIHRFDRCGARLQDGSHPTIGGCSAVLWVQDLISVIDSSRTALALT